MRKPGVLREWHPRPPNQHGRSALLHRDLPKPDIARRDHETQRPGAAALPAACSTGRLKLPPVTGDFAPPVRATSTLVVSPTWPLATPTPSVATPVSCGARHAATYEWHGRLRVTQCRRNLRHRVWTPGAAGGLDMPARHAASLSSVPPDASDMRTCRSAGACSAKRNDTLDGTSRSVDEQRSSIDRSLTLVLWASDDAIR